MLKEKLFNHRWIALFIFFFFALLHLSIVVVNHYYYKTFAYDYGVYNFAFFDYAHLRISPCPVYLTPNPITFLQDHFSLTLLFLSPTYWILSPVFGTYTLLIVQWAFIIAGAWATYKFILLKGKNTTVALLAMIYYFILYGRFASYESDCNLVIIGSAVLPVFLYYFEKRNAIGIWTSFIFLMCNREDFPLDMSLLCLMLILIHRKDKTQRRLALQLCVISILAFVLIFIYVIPFLEDDLRKYTLFNYSAFGKTPGEAFIFFLAHPVEALKMLFFNHTTNEANDGIKMEFYLVYFISGGALLFLRPVYLIPFIPLILKKVFNDDPLRWGIEMYQSVEVASLLPILVFSIVLDIKLISKTIVSFVICFLTLCVTYYCLNLYTKRAFGFNKVNFLTASFYKSDQNRKEINELVKNIPDTSSVCASGSLLTHLSLRKHIFHFPYCDESEYTFVQRSGSTWPIYQLEFDRRLRAMLESKEWLILKTSQNYMLLKRK